MYSKKGKTIYLTKSEIASLFDELMSAVEFDGDVLAEYEHSNNIEGAKCVKTKYRNLMSIVHKIRE